MSQGFHTRFEASKAFNPQSRSTQASKQLAGQTFIYRSAGGGVSQSKFSPWEETKQPSGTSQQIDQLMGMYQPVREFRAEVSDSERMKIAAQDFGKMMRSKQEIYSILVTQGKCCARC